MAEKALALLHTLKPEDYLGIDRNLQLELAQYGVLGMRWGVRMNRDGKRVGKPAKGTPRAGHDTPSVAPPGSDTYKRKAPVDNKVRKTASPGGETSIPSKDGGKRIVVKLDQKQKSKLGTENLKFEDMSIEQLKSVADRMKLETELVNALSGPTKEQAMQAVVNRIKLEAEYKRLTAVPPSKRKVLLTKAGKTLGNLAAKQALNIVDAALEAQVKKFLTSQGLAAKKKK